MCSLAYYANLFSCKCAKIKQTKSNQSKNLYRLKCLARKSYNKDQRLSINKMAARHSVKTIHKKAKMVCRLACQLKTKYNKTIKIHTSPYVLNQYHLEH